MVDLALWEPASPAAVSKANAKSVLYSYMDLLQPAATSEDRFLMCKSALKEGEAFFSIDLKAIFQYELAMAMVLALLCLTFLGLVQWCCRQSQGHMDVMHQCTCMYTLILAI